MYALVDVLSDPLAHETPLQYLNYRRPLARLYLQHLSDQVAQGLAVHLVDRWVGPAQDLDGQAVDRLGVESVPQIAHLVQDAAQRPHIRLVPIGLVLEQLRRHVIRRADTRVREVLRAIEHLGYAKVAESDLKNKEKER